MAVLCEAISVVMRADSITRAFGRFEHFKREVPNQTLAADNEVARVGFMAPDDVRAFTEKMERHGLVYQRDGHAIDMVVVDQLKGPLFACEWLEFGRITMDGQQVSAARLKGSISSQLMKPEGWTFQGSLSHTYGFIPNGGETKSLKFLRRENGLDVYLNTLTGKEVFIGRAGQSL